MIGLNILFQFLLLTAILFFGHVSGSRPGVQGSWGQHMAHLGPTAPRWAPCWPHELCYLGWTIKCCVFGAQCKYKISIEDNYNFHEKTKHDQTECIFQGVHHVVITTPHCIAMNDHVRYLLQLEKVLWLTSLPYKNPASQITKTLGAMSIGYRSDAKVSDRYLIDVNPRILTILEYWHMIDVSMMSIWHFIQPGL